VALQYKILFKLIAHLNSDFAVSQNIKLCCGIFLLVIIGSIGFYLRKKRGLNNDLTDTSESGIINLTSGRILLFFGALIIAGAALTNAFVTHSYDDKLFLSFSLSFFLLVVCILSYAIEEVKKNISVILTAIYCLVSFYYVFLCYYSSLDPFFIICQIITLSLGTIIFEKTKHFVVFSIIITALSFFAGSQIDTAQFSINLYFLATVSILFVSIIATYVRLRLSDRLIFANTVINDGGSLVMAANKNGDVIYINKTFIKVLGFTEEEVLGQGWWKVRKVINNEESPYNKITKGEIQTTATVLLETKTGDQRWIHWNNTKLENGIFVGIGNDITERREYEQQFRKLVENANDIIYTTDKQGNFTYTNDVTAEYTGYSKLELLGKSYKLLVQEDYKHKLEAFYKEQIKNKTRETYSEFPFTTKDGRALWVGQSVLFKYEDTGNAYSGAQVICRNITERVRAEEKLRQHNADLSVINQVKEIILSSDETVNMYASILRLLGNNSDKSHYFSINIFDKYYPVLHTYGLNTSDKKVESSSDPLDEELLNSFGEFKGDILEFETDKKRKDLFAKFHQPVNTYRSAVIFPIHNASKTYGFFCFYSANSHTYTPDTLIMVKDICTSFASYFMQYEQNRIIENYSEQLEILNESKTKLISYNNLNDVYKGIIELLSDNIENVMRVSILVHGLERSDGHLFFKDPATGEITSKFISTKNVPTVPFHLKGQIYEKPDFDTDPDLTEEDKLWKSKGARSVISLPITINDTLFASVNLLSQVAHNFTDQHKALIKEINESAATVIEQLQFKEIIFRKNKDISDNITYARRIQSALMPSEDLLKEILPQSFLIFSQRDSLGGDFYWFEKRGENIFLAVGDCTGHGVSGSLLTILASDYIKQAVEGKGYTDPALILEYLSSSLQETLNKYSEDEILDGLDISFGIYNTNTKILLFSSAIHHFFLARNNELIEYKGNRKAIGGLNTNDKENNFTTYMIQLESNDVVYFTTDGFADQLENKTEKRYGKARLKQMLLQINDKDVEAQKEFLIIEHLKWKGNQSQTDDICFLGFKIQ
jgi:PAS domain S-box-containing protein